MDTLTATAIRTEKPANKAQRLFDGRGLDLVIVHREEVWQRIHEPAAA